MIPPFVMREERTFVERFDAFGDLVIWNWMTRAWYDITNFLLQQTLPCQRKQIGIMSIWSSRILWSFIMHGLLM